MTHELREPSLQGREDEHRLDCRLIDCIRKPGTPVVARAERKIAVHIFLFLSWSLR